MMQEVISGSYCRVMTVTKSKKDHVHFLERVGFAIHNRLEAAVFKLRRRQRPPKVKALPAVQVLNFPEWKKEKPFEPKSGFESGQAFAHFLKKKGFTKLGAGSYSEVWAKGDSKRVLKVCYRLDAWMDYISWAAKKGYCGTFAPRVYSYKYFKGVESPFYVAVVERLHDECGRIDNHHPQAFTQKAFTWNTQNPNHKVAEILDVLHPGLKQFTFDFRDFITKDKHQVDYHGGNFMVRKDGTFVATDPIMGHQEKPSTNRLRTKDFTGSFMAPLERLAA